MPFTLTHRVQFSETDMAGVVHFANFYRWMEEVEHAYFRSVGLSVHMPHEGLSIGWPRVSSSCAFLAPVRFEDEVELHLHITALGRRSLSYEVAFTLAGKTVATGKITSVCCGITPQGLAPLDIPPDIRRRLESGPHQP